MARYRGTVSTDRSVDEVFEYLAEFSNAAEWDPGVSEARRLDVGPVGRGSAFRLLVRVGQRTVPLDYRIVAFEPPTRVDVVADNGVVRSEDHMTVTANAAGGSTVTYDADLRLRGAFVLAEPLVRAMFHRIGDRGIAGLREVLSARRIGAVER